MPIYSTQKVALRNSLPQQGSKEPVTNYILKSCLLKDHEELQGIINEEIPPYTVHIEGSSTEPKSLEEIPQGGEVIYTPHQNSGQIRVTYRSEAIVALKKGLDIVIQSGIKSDGKYFFGAFNPSKGIMLNDNFVSGLKGADGEYTPDYDEGLALTVEEFSTWAGLPVDMIAGPRFIQRLDEELLDIKNYDCDTGEFLFDESRFKAENSPNSTRYGEPSITFVTRNAEVYYRPHPNTKGKKIKAILRSLVTKVYIIRDLGEDLKELNSGKHWYYVQFDPNLANDPDDPTKEYNVNTKEKDKCFGFILANNVLRKNRMPDSQATMRKILPTDTVYDIIVDTYYTKVDDNGHKMNDFGTKLNTEKPEPPSYIDFNNVLSLTTYAIDAYNYLTGLKEYNTYRFYVNLLLFSNNPRMVNDADVGIWVDEPHIGIGADAFQSLLNFTHSFVTSNNPDLNPDDPKFGKGTYEDENGNTIERRPGKSNYDYFLEHFSNSNPAFVWHDADNIKIKGSNLDPSNTHNYYMWLPSKDFADRLYLFVNNHQSKLAKYHTEIKDAINAKWPRGYGVELSGDIGATFGIPVRLEGGGSVKLYRKYTDDPDKVVMVLKKHGRLAGGLDTGYGVGFYMGSGNATDLGKDAAASIQARVGAQIQANVNINCFVEYEFELYDLNSLDAIGRRDLSAIALFTSFSTTTSLAGEWLAVEFIQGFSDYNIDPSNYLTRLDLRLSLGANASVGAFAGITLGDNQDIGYWNSAMSGAPTPSPDAESPPWMVSKLISMIYAGANIGAGAEVALGYELKLSYDDQCFDKRTGNRIPKKIEHGMYTSAQVFVSGSAGAFSFDFAQIDFSPYIGFKFSQSYERTEPDRDIPTRELGVQYFDPKQHRFDNFGKPTLQISAGGGDWDFYKNSATEFGIDLKFNTDFNPNSASSTLAYVDKFYVKKRFDLLSLNSSVLKDLSTVQSRLKNYWGKSEFVKFGITAQAFLDVEFEISSERITVLSAELIDLLDKVKAIGPSGYSWFESLLNLPNIMSNVRSHDKNFEIVELLKLFYRSLALVKCDFHAEAGVGGGLGFKAAAEFKIALDAQVKLALTYDLPLSEGYSYNAPLNGPILKTYSPIIDDYAFKISEAFRDIFLLESSQDQKDFIYHMSRFVSHENTKMIGE